MQASTSVVRHWDLTLERWRSGGSRLRREDEGLCQTLVHIESASADSPVSIVWTGQDSPSGKGEGCAEPNHAVELRRRKCRRVAAECPKHPADPDAGEVAVRRFSSAV